jgi:hypothetical protein
LATVAETESSVLPRSRLGGAEGGAGRLVAADAAEIENALRELGAHVHRVEGTHHARNIFDDVVQQRFFDRGQCAGQTVLGFRQRLVGGQIQTQGGQALHGGGFVGLGFDIRQQRRARFLRTGIWPV